MRPLFDGYQPVDHILTLICTHRRSATVRSAPAVVRQLKHLIQVSLVIKPIPIKYRYGELYNESVRLPVSSAESTKGGGAERKKSSEAVQSCRLGGGRGCTSGYPVRLRYLGVVARVSSTCINPASSWPTFAPECGASSSRSTARAGGGAAARSR